MKKLEKQPIVTQSAGGADHTQRRDGPVELNTGQGTARGIASSGVGRFTDGAATGDNLRQAEEESISLVSRFPDECRPR